MEYISYLDSLHAIQAYPHAGDAPAAGVSGANSRLSSLEVGFLRNLPPPGASTSHNVHSSSIRTPSGLLHRRIGIPRFAMAPAGGRQRIRKICKGEMT